jgi:hypothetical protein
MDEGRSFGPSVEYGDSGDSSKAQLRNVFADYDAWKKSRNFHIKSLAAASFTHLEVIDT